MVEGSTDPQIDAQIDAQMHVRGRERGREASTYLLAIRGLRSAPLNTPLS